MFRSLGASRWTVARRVVLPLVRPGLFAGGAVVFVWSFTELGTPLMLGYERATPVQIFAGLTDVAQSSQVPFALVLVMLVVAALAYAVGERLGFTRDQITWGYTSFNASYAPGPSTPIVRGMGQDQLVPRAGHRDVEQAPLLLHREVALGERPADELERQAERLRS